MSFLPNQENNLQAPQGQTTNNPQGAAGGAPPPPQSGGSAGAGTAAGKAVGTATGTPTQFGSSASKLGDYLSANAPQIQNQANTLVGGLNQQYGQVQNDITNAANQFGQQVQGGYAAPNQDLVNQAVSNPTQFAATPSNVSGFQAQYNDTYSGPTSYESSQPYGAIQNEVQSAVQNAGLLNTQAGLQSYLGGQQKNPTQASTTLDALLLQGNPHAQQQIQQAAGQFGGLTDQFGNSVTAVNQGITAAQQAAQQAQQYAQGQFGNAVTGFNTNLQNELANANKGNAAYNNQIDTLRSQLQSGQLPTQYGVDPGLQAFITNQLNPLLAPLGGASYNYVNALPSNINPQLPQLGQVASQQDYATLNALNQLAGTPIQSQLDPTQAALAGTYQAPTIGNLNNQTLAQDIFSGASAVPGNLSPQQYDQYLADLAGLQNYLGNTNYATQPGNPWGSAFPRVYSNLIPNIA